MNRSHAFAGLAAALLAFHTGAASAQLYKWVDERGQVNYSNQLPVDSKSADKVAVVEDRVSVYSPDAPLLRVIEADRQRVARAAGEKPEVYQPAVAMIGGTPPAPSAAVEPPVYDYPYVVVGGYGRHRPLHKSKSVALPAGTIAGTAVGLYGIIPGSSSPVPGTWSPVAPQQPVHHRPHRPAPRQKWER
jgi:hypothetical protein